MAVYFFSGGRKWADQNRFREGYEYGINASIVTDWLQKKIVDMAKNTSIVRSL